MPITYPTLPIIAFTLLALVGATAVGSLAVTVGFPLPSGERRIGCVDGLRGYLALAVLVHHFVIWIQVTRLGGTWSPPAVYFLNNLGAGGVALFFMTTGLVFYPRILKGFRATSWVSTYTTRIFRIIPLVAISVLIITIIIMTRTGARPGPGYVKNAAEWIVAWKQPPLLDDPDAGRLDAYVLWSLWYEWVFYLVILPVCALAMDMVRGRLPSWSVAVALLFISLAVRPFHAFRDLPRFLPLFAIGMLAYEAQKSPTIRALLCRPPVGVIAAASLIVGMTSAPDPYGFAQLCLFGFFFAVVACGNSLGGILRTRGALALGECSYGIYLLHGIALSLLFSDGAGFMRSLTVAQSFIALPVLAVLIAGTTLSTYLLIERPMIDLGGRLSRALTGRSVRTDTPQVELAP